MIVRYLDPPDPKTGRATAGTEPKRIQMLSEGPIDVTRTDATATGSVRARVEALSPQGEWRQQAIVYCERAHMTFDANATGTAREKIRTFDAEGTRDLPVRVETDQFTGTCSRVDMNATSNVLRLSGAEQPVYFREIATGRQFLLDSGNYDYVKKEWTEQERLREMEPGDGAR